MPWPVQVITALCICPILNSCQSSVSQDYSDGPRIRRSTVLPGSFRESKLHSRTSGSHSVQVPMQMMDVRVVIRPRADLRLGPGVQFRVLDELLELGQTVAVFESVGVWCKVQRLGTAASGWVHCKTLERRKAAAGYLSFTTRELPAVFAVREIPVIYDYSQERPVRVRIPKGVSFPLLACGGGKKLVLIPETSSVMWLSERDVQ